jgi:hypothetical protein
MRKLSLFFSAAVLVAACAFLFADGTGTIEVEQMSVQGPVVKALIAWDSGTNDTVDVTANFYLRGELKRVVIGAGTSTGETYSVTLLDEQGVDLLAGLGASIATNTVVNMAPALLTEVAEGQTNAVLFTINDRISIKITDCGAGSAGTVCLFVR